MIIRLRILHVIVCLKVSKNLKDNSLNKKN